MQWRRLGPKIARVERREARPGLPRAAASRKRGVAPYERDRLRTPPPGAPPAPRFGAGIAAARAKADIPAEAASKGGTKRGEQNPGAEARRGNDRGRTRWRLGWRKPGSRGLRAAANGAETIAMT